MSNNSEDQEFNSAFKIVKRVFFFFIAVAIVVSIGSFFCNRAVQTVDNGIIHYEEFTEIYQTCQKLNTDLCNMQATDEHDKMFEQFSKSQRILTIKTQLNRWVEDYNGKSKMWNRSIWKSSTLPYQLTVDQFPCYTNK